MRTDQSLPKIQDVYAGHARCIIDKVAREHYGKRKCDMLIDMMSSGEPNLIESECVLVGDERGPVMAGDDLISLDQVAVANQ